jgi:hypothetical protein
MTRHGVFHLAASFSLLLLAGLLILFDVSYAGRRQYLFMRKEVRSEIALDRGMLELSNRPQVSFEADRFQTAVAGLDDVFRIRRGPTHEGIRWAPYGSDQYYALLKTMKGIDAEYDRDRRALPQQPTTRLISHTLQLWSLMLIASLLPIAWIFFQLATHPRILRELVRPIGALSTALLILAFALIVVTARSYWVGASWQFRTRYGDVGITDPLPPHYTNWGSARVVRLSGGKVQLFQNYFPDYPTAPYGDIAGYQRGGAISLPPATANGIAGNQPKAWSILGIRYSARRVGVRPRLMVGYRSLIIPAWMFAAICLIVPLIWFHRRVKRYHREYRRMMNLCPRCGYSLAGNISGVCPECGSQITIQRSRS